MNPTLIGFIKKEMVQTLRDPRMRIILFVTPVIQLILFGVAISTEVKNIRLAAHFEPGDQVMSELYTSALGSGWFLPASVTSSDPFEEVRGNEADAVLVAPPGGLTKALGRGQAPVQLLIDATNVVKAQAIEVYIKNILADVLANQENSATLVKPPVHFAVRVLYNPTLDTSIFMVPGVMCMLMCIVTLILTNMSISREKEMGTFEMLISAPVRPREIILGKTVPFVILGMSNFPLILAAAIILFGIPVRGSLIALTIAAFFFICTTVASGMLISTLARTQQQAMLGGFLFLFPAILFSGLIFPLENMPSSFQIFALVDPLAHFVGLLRNIMLKGGDLQYIVRHSLALVGLAVLTGTVSARRFHTTLP